MNERHSHHSDEDGISDGVELGNEKWINVTEFVRRTYEDAIRSGQPHKATFEAQVEDIIEENGAYTDFNGNKVYGSVKWNDDKTKFISGYPNKKNIIIDFNNNNEYATTSWKNMSNYKEGTFNMYIVFLLMFSQ